MRFSASRLKLFMSCPAAAKFKYIDNLPQGLQGSKASFGVVIHHVLDEYNNGLPVEKAIEMFKDLWENPEKLGVGIGVWNRMTSYGGLRDRGIEILTKYDENLKWDERDVLATEHPFLVPFGEHELTGFVDLVEVRRNGKGVVTLKIVDYKTATKAPYKEELALDIQFTIYMYASLQPEFWLGNPAHPEEFPAMKDGAALWAMTQDLPRRAAWFHLWNNKELDAGGRDDSDYMRLYRLVEQIQRAYDNDVFIPRIGDACTWCPYTEPCGVVIPEDNALESSSI